ncbi:MAG: hypothetical protein J6R03_01225 [Treponema sp.]|jgi:hypothetical protein|nr:hypothetical protein [Treponema sp.]
MKKILLLSIAVATLFCACKSNKIKGEDPIIVTGVPEIVDYPGLALGKAVPDWVMAIDEGANKKVSKALNLEKDTKIFVVTNKGNDLDFLKTWSDQVDVRAEVASSLEQAVAQSVQSAFEGTDSTVQEKSRAFNIYSASMTNMTLNGLEKEAFYWIRTRVKKPEVKKARKDSDYIYEYTYYVVFGIDQKLFDSQLEAAMEGIEDNTDQTQLLKDVLTEKLHETVIVDSEDNDDWWSEYDFYDAK